MNEANDDDDEEEEEEDENTHRHTSFAAVEEVSNFIFTVHT